MAFKLSAAYKTIGEVVKILDTTEPKEIKINTHTIRFWETQFKQLKPKIINNRRHYDLHLVETLKFIKFLLKSEGLTINGVKKHLNQNKTILDDSILTNIKAKYFKNRLFKVKNIIKELKE